jgi:sentrin-specific protease 1
MRKIFIPIHKGNHFTCVVIFMEEKRVSYYNSLKATERTRNSCDHKKYLQDEKKKNGYNLIDEYTWKLETFCDAPQQDNTENCGIFMCMC